MSAGYRGRGSGGVDDGGDMGATVADEVYREVSALTTGTASVSRAEAIRRVAEGLGKSVAAVSSAYYTGARRAEQAGDRAHPPSGRRGQDARRPGSPALYAEMLPLVEAGATVRQAARRFGGDADEVAEIAAGFLRWREEEGDIDADEPSALTELEDELADARRTITLLRAKNEALADALHSVIQAAQRARNTLDTNDRAADED